MCFSADVQSQSSWNQLASSAALKHWGIKTERCTLFQNSLQHSTTTPSSPSGWFPKSSTCTSSIGWEDTMDTADVVFCLACLKRHLLCPACQTLANKRESLWCIGGWAQSTHSISAFNELAWKSNFGPGMPCLSQQMLCFFMCLMPLTLTKMDHLFRYCPGLDILDSTDSKKI